MSFICTICLDRLGVNLSPEIISSDDPDVNSSETVDNSEIIATRCGHLFHLVCLKHWFRSRGRFGHDCPYCKANIGTQEYQRIYPVGDEDVGEKNQQKIEVFAEESRGLQSEIRQMEQILELMGTQLEEKKMAYEISQELLQQKSIECESLKTEREEQEIILEAIKKDCRETVENLEEKLKNAMYLFRLASQGSRDKIRSLEEELSRIRVSIPAKRSVESQTDTLPFSVDPLTPSVSPQQILDLCVNYFQSFETNENSSQPSDLSQKVVQLICPSSDPPSCRPTTATRRNSF